MKKRQASKECQKTNSKRRIVEKNVDRDFDQKVDRDFDQKVDRDFDVSEHVELQISDAKLIEPIDIFYCQSLDLLYYLPLEILSMILDYLDIKSVIMLHMTSRSFYHLIINSVIFDFIDLSEAKNDVSNFQLKSKKVKVNPKQLTDLSFSPLASIVTHIEVFQHCSPKEKKKQQIKEEEKQTDYHMNFPNLNHLVITTSESIAYRILYFLSYSKTHITTLHIIKRRDGRNTLNIHEHLGDTSLFGKGLSTIKSLYVNANMIWMLGSTFARNDLQKIFLSLEDFTLIEPDTLFKFTFSSLKRLHLQYTFLSFGPAQLYLYNSLKKNPELESLCLNDIKSPLSKILGDFNVDNLIPEINNKPNLTYLTISNCKLDLSKMTLDIPKLSHLVLSYCQLIEPSKMYLPNIKSLNISFNPISSLSWIPLHIETLILTFQKLTIQQIEFIPKFVNIVNIEIYDNHHPELLDILRKLPKLEYVTIHDYAPSKQQFERPWSNLKQLSMINNDNLFKKEYYEDYFAEIFQVCKDSITYDVSIIFENNSSNIN
jgi:hypothetical protein